MIRFEDADYPATPYPGRRPDTSFVHDDATGWAITPDPVALSGWRVGATDLDDWLAERAAQAPDARSAWSMAERVPVLCYGSNVCPSKLTWLRGALGLTGPAVLVRARCTDVAAVWAAGLRVVDDQRPATIAALPGNVEDHAVWWATPEQVRVLDRCEGRGERYRLVRLHSGEVRLADGTVVDGPLVYVAARTRRLPLSVAGEPVRCLDVPQAAAQALTGVAATSDGLTVRDVEGAPDPVDFPARLFVYGTLRPDASEWGRLAPFATGTPKAATVPGVLYDTGLGYPAMRLGPGPGVHGWVVDLAEPAAAFAELDAYEGAEYRRVRVATPGGQVSWTYVWVHPFEGFRMLTGPWG